jgi:hypothetical protein
VKILKTLEPLQERAPTEVLKGADIVASAIVASLPVQEMRAKRGADYDRTSFYQLRVKPVEKGKALEDVLTDVEKFLKKNKKLGISEVQVNDLSPNSGKFSSVSFKWGGKDYDVVIALGGNKGENFEKDLMINLDNLVAGIDSTKEAEAALAALQKADSAINKDNIDSVVPRTGVTTRAGALTADEAGKIIADIIINLKKGGKRYISVKNKEGKTVGQFGISKAFNDDLSVNTATDEWRTWLAPFKLDPKRVTEGLKAAAGGKTPKWSEIEKPDAKVSESSPIRSVLEKMWGTGYIYLREERGGFKALSIDRNFLNDTVLKNLRFTEVRYPFPGRKQISIYLESDGGKYKLEVRNPRGRGSVRPTQIQLTIMKGK